MGDSILEKIVGPDISKAIVTALGEDRSDDTVVRATVEEPVSTVVEMLNGSAIAVWYKFFGNEDECVHLPDGTKYFVVDIGYEGNGTFGVQLRKRQ